MTHETVTPSLTRVPDALHSPPTPILDSYEAYGCRVNAIGIDELFVRYEQAGFLYPAKMARLRPFWERIRQNWINALEARDELLWFAVHEGCSSWGSVCSWRSTPTGWTSQHVVSIGGPESSRHVLLAGGAVRVCHAQRGIDLTQQNWFRRTNRFANKVFGSIDSALGPANGWVGDYSYLSLPLSRVPQPASGWQTSPLTQADLPELCDLAARERSDVYVSGEALDDPDIKLEALDERYRRVGLRRYRDILIVRSPSTGSMVGTAVAYRGPLGLNFSFLENRLDLIVDRTLTPQDTSDVIRALLALAAPTYADFEVGALLIVVDVRLKPDLMGMGADHIRDYAQSVWLRGGYEAWYRHVESIYDRVAKAEHRRGLARMRPPLDAGEST